jgi:hypothetical protein
MTVLVPKTQIFLLQHVPISLVFAYGIDGEKRGLLPKGEASAKGSPQVERF